MLTSMFSFSSCLLAAWHAYLVLFFAPFYFVCSHFFCSHPLFDFSSSFSLVQIMAFSPQSSPVSSPKASKRDGILKVAFNKYDIDGSGQIDVKELKNLFDDLNWYVLLLSFRFFSLRCCYFFRPFVRIEPSLVYPVGRLWTLPFLTDVCYFAFSVLPFF